MSRMWGSFLLAGVFLSGAAIAREAGIRSAGPEFRAGTPPAPANPAVVLYDQMDNPAAADVTSQDFETGFDSFDSQAADDFVVPPAGWRITGVDVDGEYSSGGGPAAGFNVYFYADAAGLPGTLVESRLAQPFGGSAGDATIQLTSPVYLAGGVYWIAVQARQDFSPAGQWFWGNRNVVSGNPAAWENPGDGFGSGCTTWGVKTTCLPTQVGGDQLFRLNGSIGGLQSWTNASSAPVDAYGSGTTAADGIVYSGGGYSFSAAGNVANFQKWDPDTNTWTPLANLPDLNNSMGLMVYGHNGRIYFFGGENAASATVSAATRIYDIASNTWTTGAPMPDVRAFMGGGYYQGSIYVAGGYTTGNVDPAFAQLWRYDIGTDSWDTSLASMPVPLGGMGSAILDGVLYLAGGRDLGGTYPSLYAYDIAGNVWTSRAAMPAANNVPGAATFGHRLWIFGGGNPFFRSARSTELPRTPETTTACLAYDPPTDTWSECPALNMGRSFVGSTSVRNIPVAVGGYNGSTTTSSLEINLTAPEVFKDGFETASTCRWSNAGANYSYTVTTGAAVVPGVDDTGNHADDGSTVIQLPFFVRIYDQWFNHVAVGSNGHLTFGTVNNGFNPGCLPIPTATYAVFPYLTDQCTGSCFNVTCSGCGIFTSTTGTAPNRIFNIEYRTAYYNSGGNGVPLDYEVRLYEGQDRYEIVYGTVNPFTPPSSRTLAVGAQLSQASGDFTLVGCDATGGTAPPVASGESYSFEACNQP